MMKFLICLFFLLPLGVYAQTPDTIGMTEHQLKEVSVGKNRPHNTDYTSRQHLERIPAILGEKDILKYLSTMPGITSTGALDPGIYVRGGNSSENTFMVNDIEIANPDHLSGILSTFDPYILGRSVIYKSGFPQKYNGSLSSYLNMFTDAENGSKYSGEASIGLLSSALKTRGPVGKNSSFAVSLRGSYLQHMARLYNKANGYSAMPAYSFYDATASFHSRLSSNLILDCFGLFTTDQLKLEDNFQPLKWFTTSGNARLRYNQKENLFAFKIGYHTRQSSGETTQQSIFQGKNQNSTFTAETEYSRSFTNKLQFSAGGKFEYTGLCIGNDKQSQNTAFNLYTGYTGVRYEALPQWNIEGGVNYQFYSGKTTTGTWSPRFKTSYASQFCNIWFDYAKTTQYSTLYPFFSIKSPMDICFPLGRNSRPSVCHQFSLGADKQFDGHFYLYAALFWKKMYRVKDFTDGLKSNFMELENQLTEGSGTAKGIEFDFIYQSEKFYFRANYTLSESWRKFSEINLGQKFHPPYDIKHNILANTSWKFANQWTLNLLWTYHTGSYATFPTGVAIAQNINNSDAEPQFIPIYSKRYNFKLPDSHRLDISTSYLRKYEKMNFILNFGIYNAYNQPNASFVYFKPEAKDKYYTRFTPQSRVLLPFVPYLSVTLTW